MANEVGKVSVRVFPDTRGFALRTKQQLGKLKDISFKVNVELNEKQLRAKVDKLVAKTNVDLLKPSNRIKFHATLDANERDLRSEVRDMRERLQDQADSSKVKFEAELGRAAGRKGDGAGLLGLDAKQIVRDLTRELGQTTVPVNTKINGDRVVKDLERSMSSKRFDIEVEMKVDRKEALKEVESVTELISHTIKTHRKMKGMKFAIEVDKASIKRWKSELENLDSFLKGNTREIERQTKEYKKWGAEITRLKKEAAGADKELERLSKREAADLRREVEATEELAELRKEMAKSAEAHAAGVLRERRLVEKVAAIRREAAKRSTERAESEVELQKRALKIQEQIKSLEEKRTQYSNRRIEWDSEAIDQEQIRKDLQSKLDRATERLKVDSIELDVSLDQVSVEAVAARLAALARTRVATIWVNMRQTGVRELEQLLDRLGRGAKVAGFNAGKWLTQLTGLRVLWQTFRDMVDWLPRLDMMVPQIAQNTALLTAAVTGLVGAVGMGFTLINDVAQIAKLALAGPAMITGLVGSVLIVGRAIADFKDVFPEIIDYYEQLGKIVSGRVWKQAAGPIRELHKATVPLLNSHVPDWATAWGDAMGALAKGAKSKSSLLAFENFLENSIKGTRNATKGWEALGGALMNLLGAGSEVFPELGTWFSETMEDFRRWTAENAGNIDDWIRQGMTALRQLGSVAVSTGKIFKGVGDAFSAAGWPGLAEFESAMRSIGDAALVLKNSDGFMQPLKQIRRAFDQFSGLEIKIEEAFKNLWGMVGDTVENLARPMANALAYILDGFNSDKFANGFGTFITGIADFIKEIGPGLGAMTEEIGSLLGVVGTAAESWGPAFNDMLLLFASAGDKLHPGLTDFIESTGPQLQQLVEDITPKVEDFAEALGNLLGDENFQELIGDLIEDLGNLIGNLLELGTTIIGLISDFSAWYASLDEGEQKIVRWSGIVIAAFGGVALAVGRALLGFAGGAVASAFGRGLMAVARAIGRWVMQFLRAIAGLMLMLWDGLRKILPPGGFRTKFLFILKNFFRMGSIIGLITAVSANIKPLKIAEIVDTIVDALGFEDTWLGELTEGIKEEFEKAFGNKSLLDIVQEAWGDFWEDFKAGNWGEAFSGLWEDLNVKGKMFEIVAEEITKALGMGEDSEEHQRLDEALDEGFGQFFDELTDIWGEKLGEHWERFKENLGMNEVEGPLDGVGWFFETVWESLFPGKDARDARNQEWDDATTGKATGSLSGLGDSLWENTFEPEFQREYDELVSNARNWSPEGSPIDLPNETAKKAPDWLGIGNPINTDGIEVSFDFTPVWTEKVKPALERARDEFIALAQGDPVEGAEGGAGGMIKRILGLDDQGVGEVQVGFDGVLEAVKNFGIGVSAEYNSLGINITITVGGIEITVTEAFRRMTEAARRETATLAAESKARFEETREGAVTSSGGMKEGVLGEWGGMSLGAAAHVTSLGNRTRSEFGSMSSTGRSKSSELRGGVVGQFSGMNSQGSSLVQRLRDSVVSALSGAASGGIGQGSRLKSGYVGHMSGMSSSSQGIVNGMRSRIPATLTINASGPGRYTGGTFVSGLSSGLSRAVGVARGMASSIRGALSFNVSGSGRAVGGSFASGIRSKIGEVSRAAAGLAAAARSKMPNSPAEEGPFSGSGWGGWGESIAEELARGLRKSAPEVAREAQRLMGGVHTALESRSNAHVGIDFERTRRRHGLFGDADGYQANGTTVNVNVESRSEDPLRDGNRFGGDIAFALRGAGLA